jgi:DNA gyrase subunit A
MVAEESQHIMLSTNQGKAIRFPVDGIRLFKGRNSSGVRGISLAKGDKVMSAAILNGADIEMEVRSQYLKNPSGKQNGNCQNVAFGYSPESHLKEGTEIDNDKPITIEILKSSGNQDVAEQIEKLVKEAEIELDVDTAIEYARGEEFILSLTNKGYGKRSSAYEYRITKRGGKGIVNIVTNERNGDVCASFPVIDEDQIMLVTNGGKLIRCPVIDIRVAGRNTQGVTIFRIEKGETIVSRRSHSQ